MIICKICNPQLEGNGYCAEHSTGGTAYQKDMRKETIENNWEEEIKLMIPLQGCGVSTNQIIEKIRTLLALQRKEIIEEIEKMIFSCYPSDMENFNTMTDDQAHRLLKCFWKKLFK